MVLTLKLRVVRHGKKYRRVQAFDKWFKRVIMAYVLVHSVLCAVCVSALTINYFYPGHWYFLEVQAVLRSIFGDQLL